MSFNLKCLTYLKYTCLAYNVFPIFFSCDICPSHLLPGGWVQKASLLELFTLVPIMVEKGAGRNKQFVSCSKVGGETVADDESGTGIYSGELC